jgi:hypothetical protein
MPAFFAHRWTGLFAYDKATGQMLPNCVAFAAAEADTARKTELFGGCGVAPTQLMGLPTSACSETDSAMPSKWTWHSSLVCSHRNGRLKWYLTDHQLRWCGGGGGGGGIV